MTRIGNALGRLAMGFAFMLLAAASGSGLLSGDQRPESHRDGLVAARAEVRVLAEWSSERAQIGEHIAERAGNLTPSQVDELAHTILVEAKARDIEPSLVLAVIEVESAYDSRALSPKGARGLMQILPSTGRAIAVRLGVPWDGPDTLFDPVLNARLGIAYLNELRDRFGSVDIAIAAYNWGPGHIGGRLHRGEPLPVQYAKRVHAAYARTLTEG